MPVLGRLYLLGPFRFERDGGLVRLPTRKVEALLAYLALHPGQHPREKLAGLFWGDTGDAQARASLRGALPALRAQLGEALQTSGQTVALEPGALWVDALELQAQAAAFLSTALGQPSSVQADLYHGDLLEGFYDEWIGPLRAAWRGQFLEVLLQLTRRARAAGEYRQALDWAGRLLALEPASEAAHREAIASHLALGDRDAARRQYQLCLRALQDELADRFKLLTGGSRAALPRQQTLRAAMDWSHDLLSLAERRLFRRLAVFAGGFNLEAAEALDAVLLARNPDFGPSADSLDTLTRLVEQSLVQADQGRFRMLETIRQYAADQLWLAGEEAAASDRHLLWYTRLAEAAVEPPNVAQVYSELELEQDNFRAALRWAAETAQDEETGEHAELGLRLCTALWQFWGTRGYMAEGRQRLEQLLALPARGVGGPARAAALLAAGGLAIRQGDFAAARPWFEASLGAYTALGDAAGIASAQHYLGWVANAFGDYELARRHYEDSLALRRRLGPSHALEVADTLANLGMLAYFQGRPAEAAPLLAESAALARAEEDARRLAFATYLLGNGMAEQGQFAEARRHLAEALGLVESLDDRLLAAYLFESFAALQVLMAADLARAAGLFGAAEALRERLRSPCPPQWRAYCLRLSAQAEQSLGAGAWRAAWAAGRGWSVEQSAEQARR